jgi:hypothetical protein
MDARKHNHPPAKQVALENQVMNQHFKLQAVRKAIHAQHQQELLENKRKRLQIQNAL